jgi:transposase InsO family protein
MRADDVTATLDLALKASGLDHVTVLHRPRLLSDNGSSYVSEDLAKWLNGKGMADRTLLRHLTDLAAAGLIIRRDSPNGKRHARKDTSG